MIISKNNQLSETMRRRQAEEALQMEMANLDAIFDSSPVSMLILDETTNIVRANGAAISLAGCSESDVLQHRARNGIEALLANGGSLHGAELPLVLVRKGEPEKVWLRMGAEPILINGCRHLCVAMEDITARKQAEEEIQRLNTNLEQRVIDRNTQLEVANKEPESFSYSVPPNQDLSTLHGLPLPIDLFIHLDRQDHAGKPYENSTY